MKVCEIYKSIQGEGLQAGEPTIFVRFAGCNLSCLWCDTKYAHNEGVEMSYDEMLAKIDSLNCKNVCLTGGEPLMQEGILSFLTLFTSCGDKIYIETNGSYKIRQCKNEFYILDYKLPSSGHYGSFLEYNLKYKPYAIKFVISTIEDYDYARNFVCILTTNPFYDWSINFLFSPVWNGEISITELAERIIKDDLPVRYSLQLHKVLWGNKRGV